MKSWKSLTISPTLAVLAWLSLLGAGGVPAAQAQGQYGYWVQLARNATVREYPGGPTVVRNGQPVGLKAGHWFHLDPGVGNNAWGLGYACVGGGRGCNRHNSVPGFILRSALSGRTASRGADTARTEVASAGPDAESFEAGGEARYLPALFVSTAAGVGTPFLRAPERRICAREVWLRDDRLHRIGILRAGDHFYVERYTDGSKEDGARRWAIGRASGHGIMQGREYGRVLVESFCP